MTTETNRQGSTETYYYASLMGPMLGVYYPLPFDNERQNRIALNTSRLSRLWCSVYTRDEVEAQIKEFGGIMLPDEFANKLDAEREHREANEALDALENLVGAEQAAQS